MKQLLLTLFFILFVSISMASTAEFSPEQTVYLSESSTEINLTGEYSQLSIYSNKLGIEDHNFTVDSLESTSSDAEIIDWSPEDTQLFKFEVAVNGEMEYGFEGIGEDLDYVIFKDGDQFEELNSGPDETISFTYTELEDAVFTVQLKQEEPDIFLELSDTVIDESETVDVTCGGSNIDEESLTVETPEDTVEHECGQIFDQTGTPGVYTVTYSATSSQGFTSEQTASFEVQEVTSSGSGSSSTSSPPEGPKADITEEDGKTSVQIEDFTGEAFGIELPQKNRSVEISVLDLEFGETNQTTAKLDIEELGSGTAVDNFREFGSYQFTHDMDSVQKTGITFEVDSLQVENPRNIAVYRFSDDLERLDTVHEGVKGEKDVFKTQADGFSVYSIGEDYPNIGIEDIEAPEKGISGQQINIDVLVVNNGSVSGTETIDLRAEGNLAESKMVELQPGERTSLTFSYSLGSGTNSFELGDESFQIETPSVQQTEKEPSTEQPENYLVILFIISTGLAILTYMFRDELEQKLKQFK